MKYRVTFFVGNYPDAFVTDNLGADLLKLAEVSINIAPVSHVTAVRIYESAQESHKAPARVHDYFKIHAL